jgi:anti-sigma factor RsiW
VRAYRRRRFTCEEMSVLVTDYLERSLSWRNRRRFEAHLSGCDHCAEFLHQMRTTVALTGSLASDELNPARQDELLVLFRRWCLESS